MRVQTDRQGFTQRRDRAGRRSVADIRQLVGHASARDRIRRATGDHRPTVIAWDRDEWDVAMTDGTIYRFVVEREVGQWFLEGVID